jgi:fructokinase
MKILIFGEILFDEIDNNKYLGGASLNLSAHLAKSGAQVHLVSRVGDDELGILALKELKKLKINTDYIQIDTEHQTGLAKANVDKQGIAKYEILQNTAYDYILASKENLAKIFSENYDCFCFGTLAQRNTISRQTLYLLLKKIKTKHIFCDLNLRQNFFNKEIIKTSLKHSDILKINQNESEYLEELFHLPKNNHQLLFDFVLKKYSVTTLIISKGKHGCVAFSKKMKNKSVSIPEIKTQVKDTIGAGDAFSAGFLQEFLTHQNLEKACKKGNHLGAKIASQKGAI